MTQIKSILLLITMTANFYSTALRGNNYSDSISGLRQCDATSWVIFCVQLILSLALSIASALAVRNNEYCVIAANLETKSSLNVNESYSDSESDINVELDITLKYTWSAIARLNLLII